MRKNQSRKSAKKPPKPTWGSRFRAARWRAIEEMRPELHRKNMTLEELGEVIKRINNRAKQIMDESD